jgi:hypothetical protein
MGYRRKIEPPLLSRRLNAAVDAFRRTRESEQERSRAATTLAAVSQEAADKLRRVEILLLAASELIRTSNAPPERVQEAVRLMKLFAQETGGRSDPSIATGFVPMAAPQPQAVERPLEAAL